jgi:hypothetical protein
LLLQAFKLCLRNIWGRNIVSFHQIHESDIHATSERQSACQALVCVLHLMKKWKTQRNSLEKIFASNWD